MSLADQWENSSQKAGEDYYKLRFDEGEINDFRRGSLNSSAKDKFQRRLKRQNKIVGAITGGCLALMTALFVPVVCFLGYGFYSQPHSRVTVGLIFGAILILLIFTAILLADKLFGYRKNVNTDLKAAKINCERGQLKIRVVSGGRSSMTINYSVNNVEFVILEDAIGDEINKQFLSPITTVADSRETAESYGFYYLPQSKLVLYIERL